MKVIYIKSKFAVYAMQHKVDMICLVSGKSQ